MSEPGGVLKRHGFLIAAVALPVLVVVGFLLARTLPRLWVADPTFDVLYLVRSGYDSQPRKIDRSVSVVAGRLHVRWTKLENQQYAQPLHVYRFHPAGGGVEEVRLPEPPQGDELEKPVDLEVGGFEGSSIDTSPRAPDGYQFEAGSRGGSGLIGELFVRRNDYPRATIAKDGRVIPLPRSDGDSNGYVEAEFVGWVERIESGR